MSRRDCLAWAALTRWHHGRSNSPVLSFRSRSPAAGRTFRASRPGPAAWHPFSARTPISRGAAAWLHDIGCSLPA